MKAEVLCPVTTQSDGVEFGGFNQRKSEGECLVHLLTRTGVDQTSTRRKERRRGRKKGTGGGVAGEERGGVAGEEGGGVRGKGEEPR
ncbi:hypothetical protein Pcinc_021576 [Petrolisthes cinctipes]|uniref:Uncharacterized protein n=1 Tax=Petrolisthes cinctipes TaxID=88211 RepID=A0AAE1KJL5_PETCI|nr:hypothetical protein Pcinc_021576 [Petrolisthes cinctipes]